MPPEPSWDLSGPRASGEDFTSIHARTHICADQRAQYLARKALETALTLQMKPFRGRLVRPVEQPWPSHLTRHCT